MSAEFTPEVLENFLRMIQREHYRRSDHIVSPSAKKRIEAGGEYWLEICAQCGKNPGPWDCLVPCMCEIGKHHS